MGKKEKKKCFMKFYFSKGSKVACTAMNISENFFFPFSPGAEKEVSGFTVSSF